MPTGIAGDTYPAVEVGTYPTEDLMLIELRTLSNLIQSQSGNSAGTVDELNVLRNDQAFELNLPTPVPGTTT